MVIFLITLTHWYLYVTNLSAALDCQRVLIIVQSKWLDVTVSYILKISSLTLLACENIPATYVLINFDLKNLNCVLEYILPFGTEMNLNSYVIVAGYRETLMGMSQLT